MPSMPMLSTPQRSAHSAARPASRIGTVSRRAVPIVPDEVNGSSSVHKRVMLIKVSSVSAPVRITLRRTLKKRARSAARVSFVGDIVGVIVLMLMLPLGRRTQPNGLRLVPMFAC